MVRDRALAVAELLAVFAWALVITRPYQDLDPAVLPLGREYVSTIQMHHLWTWARQCGWCALWNGSMQGGAPALADPYGSTLHPVVVLPTLVWGVATGAKLALVGSFFMAGVAQWWLGHVLGLGRTARVWSAGMAVAAGSLAGRMELGAFAWVVSTAACALVLPPLIAVSRGGSRRSAVALGVTLALAAVAGQGYMQIGLLCTLPAVALLWPLERPRLVLIGKRYALAAVLATLLAAPFLVPFLHLLPEFGKEIDPTFRSAQPLRYVPLNLVVNDFDFYTSEALHKLPYPALYVNYIGWIAMLLALGGLGWSWRGGHEARRMGLYLGAVTFLAMWVASAAPLSWLTRHVPWPWLAVQLAGIRFPSVIAGLAVPCLLAAAAVAVDRLARQKWARRRRALVTSRFTLPTLSLDARWLFAVPLLAALLDVGAASRQWIHADRYGAELPAVLDALRTPDLQWVNPPFGEHFWTEAATASGLKMSNGIQRWHWKGRPAPEAVLEGSRFGPPPAMVEQIAVGGLTVYAAPPGREYAAVADAGDGAAFGGRTVCAASGVGGDVDVRCDAPRAGVLTVKENSWSGWRAYVDGRPAALRDDRWLAVDLPAGSHTVAFRYRPWDAPLGLLLCSLGMALATYVWCTAGRRPVVDTEGVQPRGVQPQASSGRGGREVGRAAPAPQ